jgi:hypothetical protein
LLRFVRFFVDIRTFICWDSYVCWDSCIYLLRFERLFVEIRAFICWDSYVCLLRFVHLFVEIRTFACWESYVCLFVFWDSYVRFDHNYLAPILLIFTFKKEVISTMVNFKAANTNYVRIYKANRRERKNQLQCTSEILQSKERMID